jgi:hypothetical protein
MRVLSPFRLLTLGLALIAVGCRKDPPPLPPPPPAVVLPPPTAGAGSAPTAANTTKAEGPSPAPAQPDVFQPPEQWNRPRPANANPTAVTVGVDVVGAGSGPLAPSNPAAWFKDMCGSRYECRLQSVQEPGKAVVTLAKLGATQDQVGKAVDKQWLEGTSKARAERDTNVPAWTTSWLEDKDGGDVAVLWFDGMADSRSANAVVADDKLTDLGGAWVLPGRIVNGRKGEPTALMVYILSRTGKVAEGWKVARDLATHAKSSMADSRQSAYRVEFVADGALELYPGDLWSGIGRLKDAPPTLKSLANGVIRKPLVREATEPEATARAEFALPAVVRFDRLAGSPKLPLLVSIAEQWDASSKSDPGISGWSFEFEISGSFPAVFPTRPLAVSHSWRVRPFPKDTSSWAFADNNSPDFRQALTLLSACAGGGPAGTLRIGLADVLPCPFGGDPVMTCGAVAAGQLGNNVFGHPAIRKLLASEWPEKGCALRALSQPISGVAVVAPIRGPVALSAFGSLDVPLQCFEQTLPESPQLAAIGSVVEEMRRECDSRLLAQMRTWLSVDAQLPLGTAFAEETLNLTLPNGGKTAVNKLYAFRLLHKFAQSLGRRSLQNWRVRTQSASGPPELEMMRVVVESPRDR